MADAERLFRRTDKSVVVRNSAQQRIAERNRKRINYKKGGTYGGNN